MDDDGSSLRPPISASQTISRSVQPILHTSRQRVPILYNGPPSLPLKLLYSHGGSGPRSYTCFLWPIPVHISNDMSIGSAVFAGLTIVTDRPRDRPTDSNSRPLGCGLIMLYGHQIIRRKFCPAAAATSCLHSLVAQRTVETVYLILQISFNISSDLTCINDCWRL